MTQLKELIHDEAVEDIVLKQNSLLFYKKGRWHGPVQSEDCQEHKLQQLCQQIANQEAVVLGLTQPTCDTHYSFSEHHHFRVHIVCSPMSFSGTEITLRRLSALKKYKLDHFCKNLAQKKTLEKIIISGKSLLIVGATGSGKSTLLASLLNLLSEQKRILILEDSNELTLPNQSSSKLLTRNNPFGFRLGAEWDLSRLVYEALRMRPDRIVLGECRGKEAYAIASALQTGHSAIYSTLHAGSVDEGIHRFKNLCLLNPQARASAFQLSPWDWGLHVKENSSGKRQIQEIKELSCEAVK